MSQSSFQYSFARACDQLGVDAAAIGEDGALAVGDTQVFVDHAEPADLCRIVIDLGLVPAERAAELSRVMLEANCVDATDILLVFSLHPANGHAVLTMFVPVAGLDSQRHDLAVLLSERVPELIDAWAEIVEHGVTAPPDTGSGQALVPGLGDGMALLASHA